MAAARRRLTGSPVPGYHPVDSGTAQLLGDADRPESWVLLVDGTPQSHVDLADPTYLDFEYVRRIGHLIDLTAPEHEPIDVLHLGAGALTLARYVAATRPGSRQRAVDDDAALVQLIRDQLPLPRDLRLRVRVGDAREELASLPGGSVDVVVCDVFRGARTPAALTSREFYALVAGVLRPGGVCALNVGDGPPLRFTRSVVATLQTMFVDVAVLADPAVLRERRFGNLVCAGSSGPLPLDGLRRRCAGDPAPGRVMAEDDVRRFAGLAPVITDESAEDSPAPPPGLFG